MFAKTHVRQNNADPVYKALAIAAGEYPGWNFHKYLLDRNGRMVASYASTTDPFDKSLVGEIKSQLKRF